MANIRHNLTIKASAEQVFYAITSEKGLRGWWTNSVTAKPEEGHINSFKFGDKYFNKMKITTLNSPIEVVWECVDGDKEWIGTNLSFEMNEKEGTTLLKFSHLNWAGETEFFGFCSHHWGRYLDSLKSLCETGNGQPFTE